KSIIAELLVRAIAVNGTPDQVVDQVLKNIAAKNGNPETAVKLGKVLNRPELITKGLESAKKQEGGEYSYVELLVGLGRYAEAETAIAGMSVNYAGTAPQTLFKIYSRLGRYQDVIDLLDFSQDWGVTDLKDLAPRNYGSVHVTTEETNILLEAARAFLKTGKRDLGLKVLVEALAKDTKDDDAYDLYVQTVTPAEAIAKFDDMFAHDQFEERPLIWKAIVLQRSGKIDEAEAVVRHAIAVDPSDGDMGKNKRMLGYKVLSEILATKGNDKDSKFFMSVVDAIRLSENADDFMTAGLARQAITMYGDSLKIFADAYCIQSRIAVNLANEGKTAEAIEHFKHAFELMPSSFGRVETHCFGCEGVFTTGPAEGIAETVLQDAAKKNPNKPQSQYLLGYLRREQGRGVEAAQYFRRAVELDPDYLNAWKELLGAADTGVLSIAENERIVLNLLRLDPQEKHGSLSISSVQLKDFSKLYDALANVYSSVPPGGVLYELSGSKKSNEGNTGRYNRSWYVDEVAGLASPGSRIATMEPVRSILNSIQTNGRISY
ncbi:MAG: tetratricopeptide repeat protein, partial [Armatimonadota bacterium]